MLFFSSTGRHTRCYRDWSSDVCSSDLVLRHGDAEPHRVGALLLDGVLRRHDEERLLQVVDGAADGDAVRSEERRVGKECGRRWRGYVYKEHGWGHDTGAGRPLCSAVQP